MSVLDLASGKVTTRVKVGEEPEAVTLRPDGSVAYVGCEGENEVVAVDTASAKVVGRIKTGPRPRGIALTSDGATAFVGNENGASITVVDGAKHTVLTTITIPKRRRCRPSRARWESLSPDGRTPTPARPGQGDRGHRCPEARVSSHHRGRERRPRGHRAERRRPEDLHRQRRLRRCLGRRRGDRQGGETNHRRQSLGCRGRGYARDDRTAVMSLLLAILLAAQTVAAPALSGVVRDGSGQVVPGAVVIARVTPGRTADRDRDDGRFLAAGHRWR